LVESALKMSRLSGPLFYLASQKLNVNLLQIKRLSFANTWEYTRLPVVGEYISFAEKDEGKLPGRFPPILPLKLEEILDRKMLSELMKGSPR